MVFGTIVQPAQYVSAAFALTRRAACLCGGALLMVAMLAAPAAAADPVYFEEHFYEVVETATSWNDAKAMPKIPRTSGRRDTW